MPTGSSAEGDQRYVVALGDLERLVSAHESNGLRLDRALSVICEALRVPLAKILELAPAADVLTVRAGIGWREGIAGQATVPASQRSSAGYALPQDHAVVFENIQRTRRFSDATLLLSHNVVSGIAVRIARSGRALGVLSVHALNERSFSSREVSFIEAAAVLVAHLL